MIIYLATLSLSKGKTLIARGETPGLVFQNQTTPIS